MAGTFFGFVFLDVIEGGLDSNWQSVRVDRPNKILTNDTRISILSHEFAAVPTHHDLVLKGWSCGLKEQE